MASAVRPAESAPATPAALPVLPLWAGAALLAAAILLRALAYPPFHQGWCIWLTLVPMLLLVRFPGWWSRRPFLAGWLGGFLWHTGMLWWLGHVTVIGLLMLTAYLGLYSGVWLWAVARWTRRLEARFGPAREHLAYLNRTRANLLWAGMAASWWVMLEFLRGWLMTGFGWNSPGVALWENGPILQLASVGGVLLLSGLVVFVNALVAAYAANLVADLRGRMRGRLPRRASQELGVALLATALVFAWGLSRELDPEEGGELLHYVLIQPNIPQERYSNPMPTHEKIRRHLEVTRAGISTAMKTFREPADVVIWPEATTYLEPSINQGFGILVQNLANEALAPLIFGAQYTEPTRHYTGVYATTPDGPTQILYKKNHLVLFGEYIPLRETFTFLENVAPVPVQMVAGTEAAAVAVPYGPPAGVWQRREQAWLIPLICFEDTVPRLVRTAARGPEGPKVLVNMTNDSWFKDSPGAWMHLANAVPRTVETGLPMLRATNTGVTAQIDRYGHVRNLLEDGNGRAIAFPGALVGTLYVQDYGPTLYQRWGDWPAPLAAVVCLLAGFYVWKWGSDG